MGDEPTVVLVVPIAPAATGNGLAMRAGMLLDALAVDAAVHVVVVPVSGLATQLEWAKARARSVTVVEPVGPETAQHHTTCQLADPELRTRLTATAPLPARAALAPPTLVDAAAAELPDAARAPAAVLAMRLYLAPFGVRLARRLGAARTVVDADEDDGALLRALGDPEQADACDRLTRCWLPDADAAAVASTADAASIEERIELPWRVDVIPNVVTVPPDVPPPPGLDRLLFVGNLTYAPNVDAARLLASEIVPRVRETRPNVTLDLVGAHDGSLRDLGALAGVRVIGSVPDVEPYYSSADVVVAPVRTGGGTRIKVLEALAHRRPLVATPQAVAGLAVGHDEAVIADSLDDFARGIAHVLADPDGASGRVARGFELVSSRYTPVVVGPRLRALVLAGAA